jgi:hypothetical protein
MRGSFWNFVGKNLKHKEVLSSANYHFVLMGKRANKKETVLVAYLNILRRDMDPCPIA